MNANRNVPHQGPEAMKVREGKKASGRTHGDIDMLLCQSSTISQVLSKRTQYSVIIQLFSTTVLPLKIGAKVSLMHFNTRYSVPMNHLAIAVGNVCWDKSKECPESFMG